MIDVLAINVRMARESRQMSVADLAAAIHEPIEVVLAIENGQCKAEDVSLADLEAFAAALGVTVSVLVTAK